MEQKAEKVFIFSIFFAFLIKSILAIIIPITGDEAYFVLWAKHLDFGYYDHTPLVGWILSIMLFFGSSEFIVRFPAIISSILVGIGIYLIIKPYDKIKACLISTLFIVSPISILNFLISTDTPLIISSFFSGYFLFLALNRKNYFFYFIAGIFLGFAFLSKYLAVLIGLTYLVYFIFTEKRKDKTLGFIILFISIIPFAVVNIYWNYTHDWANIMFNMFSRTKKESIPALYFLFGSTKEFGVSFLKLFIFILVQLYLFTPPILYYLFKKRKELLTKLKIADNFLVFFYIFIIPLLFYAFLSIKKSVSPLWMFYFYSFLFVLLYLYLSEMELTKSIEFMVLFTLIHLIFISAVLSIPPKYFKNNSSYYEIIQGMKTKTVLYNLKPFEKDFVLTTPSYTDSAILYFHSGIYFPVFDGGTLHGRQDDFITDYKLFSGKNILVLKKRLPEKERYEKFFKKYEVKQFEVEGAVFYIVLGYDFNFNNYRDIVLKDIKDKFYSVPKFLPTKSDYFKEKYFS
ncbi:MAG: glycosyltransferase family 39 protein [Elusimicrobia bacterium]|nr:glycosyltransferase family 39 protein [Elusimicrobiota bacterium]